ncbi:MAG: putative family ISMav2-like transposase [Pseudonocardia sp.]|nr:putative family ISMav2-like transposase [Pseudonocardia sp.]
MLLLFGFVITELSVMEQRYQAVLEVEGGIPVVEVAARFGVSRQAIHRWVARYRGGGLEALADRSKRPRSSPWQVAGDVEALVCQLRREHPRWGPRRLRAELGRRGVAPLPHRSSIYRILLRFQLVTGKPRRRRREDYTRWEREGPMQLWQMDLVGSCFLTDGRELKIVTGIDDHSRYCVIAAVVLRGTGRAVCTALVHALQTFGCPDEVLTDNGKQFTGRFTRPHPVEVLFERICRRNGIHTILTKPRSPTTTGKVERFHQALQQDCLDLLGPFDDVAAAQKAVDEFRYVYNHERPHQGIDDDVPASRFTPVPAAQRQVLGLDIPTELRSYLAPAEHLDRLAGGFDTPPEQAEPPARQPDREPASEPHQQVGLERPQGELTQTGHWLGGPALQLERVVTPTGNITVGRHQIWIGFAHIGRTIGVWADTTTIHLAFDRIDGPHFKTVPSRLTTTHLTRLRAAGAVPAGPPPVPRTAARGAPTDAVVEVERVVNTNGLIGLGSRHVSVGQRLAGQRIILRFDGAVAHVIADGVLAATIPAPVPPELRGRLRGARLATPDQRATPAATRPVIVQRKVSDRGTTQVAGQQLQVGFAHRNTLVDVHIGDHEFQIYDTHGELLATITKTTSKDVSRYKAYGWQDNIG